ncbi:MAG TPA: translational GTPase TypA [Opitutales bacterium]|nr:translational GTPase TypA [Opitutales bacterium]
MNSQIRNIAIIAHVDHGKTTLVDCLLKEGGVYSAHQAVQDRAMDSMELEREKGITIKAKNTSVHWKGSVLNIVDTPGHADFGGEVERVLKMVDGVLLIVDAFEGPQAQTRFVLRKAMQHGLKPIVVINKIDRDQADPQRVHDEVLELFLELEATDEQFNAPFLYASAKNGFAVREIGDEKNGMAPLIETVFEVIPPPEVDLDAPFKMLVSNIDWDDYVGRIAVGKILSGKIAPGDTVYVFNKDGSRTRTKVSKVFEFTGLGTREAKSATAGGIVGLAGFDEIDIGVTIAAEEDGEALPFVDLDPPTIQMYFRVNDGPLAGLDGKFVTSRQIRERLLREAKTNISIQVDETESSAAFSVSARGAMQIAVLVEEMRREGFELLVSRPSVITKTEGDVVLEPIETLWVEVPEEDLGGIMQNLSNRKGKIVNMTHHNLGVTVEALIPTRGLIGFETDLINMTSGEGIMSHLFHSYEPISGEIQTRQTGTLVATEQGVATAFALSNLESRGKLFIGPGETVYEGMIVGENPRDEDLPVNPTREKQLSNVRSHGEGKGIQLAPPVEFSLERAIEYIANDEYVEATPKNLRLRKRTLDSNERRRELRASRGA